MIPKRRVVFDMTFAAKSLTGTQMYAHQLKTAVESMPGWEVLSVAASAHKYSSPLGNVVSGLRNLIWLQGTLPARLRALDADLLHAPAYLSPFFAPRPVVLNILDTIILLRPQDFDVKWRLYERLVINLAVRRAAAIVTMSEFSKAHIMQAYPVSPERIEVIYPALSPQFQPQTHDACISVKRKYDLADSYCLFVGALEKRKNLVELVKAFALLREQNSQLQLVLVGPKGVAAGEVMQAINEYKLGGRVRHLGFVAASDLPSLYAAAELFVFPSLVEGFGLPLLEAMASGTPIVAAPCPPISEVVGNAAFLANGTGANALAEAIALVLSDPALTGELRARGLERAQQFSLARMAQQTIALYERVLADAPRRTF